MCLAITDDFDESQYDEYEYRKEIEEMDRSNKETCVADFASHDVGDICSAIAKRHANNITAVENGLEVEDGEHIRIDR